MNYTEQDVKTIKSMLEELRIYRNEDEELREMANDGLYSDEIDLANKLGIEIED